MANKYVKGATIRSMGVVDRLIKEGEYIMLKDRWNNKWRPVHPGYLQGMQFRTVSLFIKDGRIAYAKINPKYKGK